MTVASKPRKTRRRRTPVESVAEKQAGFLGLRGLWKDVAQFGIAGCVAASMMYSTLYLIPKLQEKHQEALKEDRKAGFEHGEMAVKSISKSLDGLKDTFVEQQAEQRHNQARSIELQEKMIDVIQAPK